MDGALGQKNLKRETIVRRVIEEGGRGALKRVLAGRHVSSKIPSRV